MSNKWGTVSSWAVARRAPLHGIRDRLATLRKLRAKKPVAWETMTVIGYDAARLVDGRRERPLWAGQRAPGGNQGEKRYSLFFFVNAFQAMIGR